MWEELEETSAGIEFFYKPVRRKDETAASDGILTTVYFPLQEEVNSLIE